MKIDTNNVSMMTDISKSISKYTPFPSASVFSAIRDYESIDIVIDAIDYASRNATTLRYAVDLLLKMKGKKLSEVTV